MKFCTGTTENVIMNLNFVSFITPPTLYEAQI